MGHRIAVFGASGYAGGELVRIVDAHSDLELTYLAGHSTAGGRLGDVHPQLAGGDRPIGPMDVDVSGDVDLVFLSLPHGASAEPAVALRQTGVPVVDLGSDFRLHSPDLYQRTYGTAHPHPDQLGAWQYGLPELHRRQIATSTQVAAPGCYPTSVILAMTPLLAAGLVEPTITVDAMSGVSGAGRGVKEGLMFGAVAEGVAAYGLPTHRHRPEMEQALAEASGVTPIVAFTPHLVPMQRGLHSTCHAPLADLATTTDDIVSCLRDVYADDVFVDVVDGPPQTRWVVGSNRCLISAHVDPHSGTVTVISVIDNLVKGAAGQAVQCANLMLGIGESTGLSLDGWMP